MGRQKHDIGNQKARHSAARRVAPKRRIDTDELARDLVRRGLASPAILRASRYALATPGRTNRKDG